MFKNLVSVLFGIVLVPMLILGSLYFALPSVLQHYYQEFLQSGKLAEFFQIKNYRLTSLTASTRSYTPPEVTPQGQLFHFKNFQMMLPLDDPYFKFIPIINQRGSKTLWGVRVLSPSHRMLATLIIDDPINLTQQKEVLFQTPLFKKFLNGVNQNTLFTEVFSKDLSAFPKSHQVSEFIYYLYLAKLRNLFLPQNLKTIETSQSIARVETTAKDLNYKQFYFYFLHQGDIYRAYFTTLIDSIEAKRVQDLVLSTINVSPSSKHFSHIYTSHYYQLPKVQKDSQLGWITLFSAWTHRRDDKKILQTLIHNFERKYHFNRGELNKFSPLLPIYQYLVQTKNYKFDIDLAMASQLLTAQEVLPFKIVKEE